jgi:hypothetical protein
MCEAFAEGEGYTFLKEAYDERYFREKYGKRGTRFQKKRMMNVISGRNMGINRRRG